MPHLLGTIRLIGGESGTAPFGSRAFAGLRHTGCKQTLPVRIEVHHRGEDVPNFRIAEDTITDFCWNDRRLRVRRL